MALRDLDPTCPLAFGRIVHPGTPGQLTITTIKLRRDGSEGTPYSRAFENRRAWLSELEKARHAEGHHFCFSTFAGACVDGTATGVNVANVRYLTALYQDLDWHLHPEASQRYGGIVDVLAEVDRRCDAIRFPRPDLITSSGRGLLIAWTHRPVPAYWRDGHGSGRVVREGTLVRWDVVQRFLREMFADLGADPAAIPACHWFKLPGTINAKSGNTVAVIRQPGGSDRGSFSGMYATLEPTIRAAHERGELKTVPLPKSMRPTPGGRVVDMAIQRATRRGQAVAQRDPQGRGITAADTAAMIWAPRLRALVRLAEHRAGESGGELPPGQRDCILFVTGLAMAWCSREGWESEFLELARRLTPWFEREARARLAAVRKRAGEEQGQGTGLYAMSSERLRAFVHLTDEEEDLASTSAIASPEAQHRHALRRLADRRRTRGRADRKATTGADRPTYCQGRKAAAAAKAARAHELHGQGATVKEIAAAMGCDPRVIRRHLAAPIPAAEIPAATTAPIRHRREAAKAAENPLIYLAQRRSIQDGQEPPEIAEALGVSIGQVRAWLRPPVRPRLAA